ncbi:UNVERIFIED_CONTAM: hypothetical protein K2H54_012357 [Gekko kuhli]
MHLALNENLIKNGRSNRALPNVALEPCHTRKRGGLQSRLPTSVRGVTGSELGRITFVFDTICSEDCSLYFIVDINKKFTNVVKSWSGMKEKQLYTYVISKNASYTFTWAFQRTNQAHKSRKLIYDMARIYMITVTNTVDGVASFCQACAVGSEQSGSSCIPCPTGHYIEKETSQCKECPPNTYLSIYQVYGQEACVPCGPGSQSTKDHSACLSNCKLSYVKDNQSLTYDFSNLNGVGSVMSGPSFTARGTKFFHFFNISLCGKQGPLHTPKSSTEILVGECESAYGQIEHIYAN